MRRADQREFASELASHARCDLDTPPFLQVQQTPLQITQGFIALDAGIDKRGCTLEIERALDAKSIIGEHRQLLPLALLLLGWSRWLRLQLAGQLFSGLMHLAPDLFAHGGSRPPVEFLDAVSCITQVT